MKIEIGHYITELSGIKRTPWRVTRACPFSIPGLAAGEIPAGFCVDGASVPNLLKFLFRVDFLYGKEAGIHDWLYYIGCPKAIADGFFLDSMKQNKDISVFERTSAYLCVTCFGHAAYRAHRKAGHSAKDFEN